MVSKQGIHQIPKAWQLFVQLTLSDETVENYLKFTKGLKTYISDYRKTSHFIFCQILFV